MSTELLINVTPSESRVALIENGVLQEIQLERIGNLGIVGNIYLGKISRVLPGMQAAFVDIGLEKAVNYGAAHGALAMTTPGDTSMVSLDEVVKLVENPNLRVVR